MQKIMNNKSNLSLLVSRFIIGSIFITAGWLKISDMKTTLMFFHSIGVPSFLAYIVSYGEFVGGILLVLGLWACVTSAFLGIIMLVAIYKTWALGFTVYGLPLAVLAGLISIFGNGSGKYSLKNNTHSMGDQK